MDTTRWIGMSMAGGLLTVHALQQGTLGIFLDPPTAVLVFGGGALGALGIVGRRWRALPRALRSPAPGTELCLEAQSVVRSARRAVWLVALVATLMGATAIIQGLGDPTAFGPTLARAPLALLYAAVAELFVLAPLRGMVDRGGVTAGSRVEKRVAAPSAGAC